jgi:hypothetical protein
MALLDPYATASEYRSRVSKRDTADDTEITNQLLAVSRMLEYELRVAPGTFNSSSASVTRYFNTILGDEPVLRLVDERGQQHVLQTIATDGIAVDTDGDGDYDYTVDPTGESWIIARPYNAAALGEPWDSLEILPYTTATFTKWPTYMRGVRITGTWGWPAVPGMIKELTVKMTRDIRDSEEAGAAGSRSGVALKPDTWRLWLSAKQQYGSRYLVVA